MIISWSQILAAVLGVAAPVTIVVLLRRAARRQQQQRAQRT